MSKGSPLGAILKPLRWLAGRGAETKDRPESVERRQGGDDLPDVFAVISWGCAGTKWLSHALATHPGILSVHSFNSVHEMYVPAKAALTDVQVLNVLRLLGRGYALVGDVHGINRWSVPELKETFGDSFQAAAVIRDPVKRLLSQISLFEHGNYSEKGWGDLDYLRHLPGFERVYRYYPDRKKRFFMHAANLLNAVLEERQHCLLFRMEDLTTRPESLCELVRHLSGGKLAVAPAWAEQILARPAV